MAEGKVIEWLERNNNYYASVFFDKENKLFPLVQVPKEVYQTKPKYVFINLKTLTWGSYIFMGLNWILIVVMMISGALIMVLEGKIHEELGLNDEVDV